ncbi:hypothetical protein GUJ93_ZPchr0002g25054 [Zizania palustris]|uniref:Uncharacterized protein n=1 Tax=Zizania palustris TaxID=103762 RepID=A0A8J5SPM8_ZIZPA|nr:hypothetical protein GUJ93_ZPchr0002g25054 [Zizania palustris]
MEPSEPVDGYRCQNEALLSINIFQKDLSDINPLRKLSLWKRYWSLGDSRMQQQEDDKELRPLPPSIESRSKRTKSLSLTVNKGLENMENNQENSFDMNDELSVSLPSIGGASDEDDTVEVSRAKRGHKKLKFTYSYGPRW